MSGLTPGYFWVVGTAQSLIWVMIWGWVCYVFYLSHNSRLRVNGASPQRQLQNFTAPSCRFLSHTFGSSRRTTITKHHPDLLRGQGNASQLSFTIRFPFFQNPHLKNTSSLPPQRSIFPCLLAISAMSQI